MTMAQFGRDQLQRHWRSSYLEFVSKFALTIQTENMLTTKRVNIGLAYIEMKQMEILATAGFGWTEHGPVGQTGTKLTTNHKGSNNALG